MKAKTIATVRKKIHKSMIEVLQYGLDQRDGIIQYIFNQDKNPFTLEEIGKEIGLTRQRVHQIARRESRCPKCGNVVLGDEDALCGHCAGEQPEVIKEL